MSLKLSAGCQCCDAENVCPTCCSDGTVPAEFDVAFSGLSDTTDCGICDNLNGTFTVSNPKEVTPTYPPTGWADGWSGISTSQSSDVPTGATSACVWQHVMTDFCSWTYNEGSYPMQQQILKRFDIDGIVLAKFKIGTSNFKWRLIVVYNLNITCTSDYTEQSDAVSDGWYWELSETSNDCNLSGSESWTSYFPTVNLSVDCMLEATATFADYCGGSLSLTSVEDG